ncbi:MAG TPA: CoA ester lyase [Candidatus Nitrosotalea sp.]|nr:CoA ester lyase [Candidatus Nitrosotalea sp.]
MKPYRSILFVPGNRERMLEKSPGVGADALLFDLEDAVPDDDVVRARQMVRERIQTLAGVPAFVRVNSVATGKTHDDLVAVVVAGLDGIFLPKVQTPEEVVQVAGWLDELEAGAGVSAGRVEIIGMMESALGVRAAFEIATASPRMASLCFGSGENGDFQTDLGCAWSVEGTEMLYARSKVVLDARAAGMLFPLDGVFVDIDNLEALEQDTRLSKRLGYTGRAIIHPKHIETVNRIYTPPAEELDYYRRLLAAFEVAVAEGKASVTYEGKMIDYAMVARARQVIGLAESMASSR